MSKKAMRALIGLAACSAGLAGCGGEAPPAPSPEEKAKIQTAPTPEKSAAGKKATIPKTGID